MSALVEKLNLTIDGYWPVSARSLGHQLARREGAVWQRRALRSCRAPPDAQQHQPFEVSRDSSIPPSELAADTDYTPD